MQTLCVSLQNLECTFEFSLIDNLDTCFEGRLSAQSRGVNYGGLPLGSEKETFAAALLIMEAGTKMGCMQSQLSSKQC